jgi:gliding motility-associated-like protein
LKRIVLAVFVLSLTLFSVSDVLASHGMGGEITWTCLPSGQFKFKMKFYRDCNGIPAPTNLSLTTNHAIGTIPMTRTQVNDISPKGVPAPGVGTCPTCAQGGVGTVEEHIYESLPITLNGVPPATGWTFYWGECCRSGSLDNISNPGSIGFGNRAVMYPYLGRNTNPCYDSSPYFAEKPSTIICTGYPFKYNPNAIDPELDSLVYAWGQPIDEFNSPIAFAPGYSLNSQLPSPTQNINNIAATINPTTGEISYKSFTGGYFATVVKVTAYKCNIKVAEVFREINVVLNNNCPLVNLQQNLPPEVNAPFADPVTGLFTSYLDTVYAGDTVNFQLSASDFQFFNNFTFQTITVEASGSQFGTNFSNTNAGCIIPPCATLSPAAPTVANPNFVSSFQAAGITTFKWITTCSHVEGLDTNCRRISNTYNFVVKATDNYCPANASNVGTISIVILPAPKLKAPTLRCASVNLDGSVSLSWTKPAVRDSQNTFHAYDVYASLSAVGPWQFVDSIKTPYDNPGTYTYTQSLASLTGMFATNAQQQSIYYYLKTRSGCRGDSVSLQSNILQTIKLDANLNGSNEAVLTWNPLCLPPLSSHAGKKYMIYKEFPLGTWSLIDSTTLLTYIDTTTKQQCIATMRYKVSLSDSSGCQSWSSIDEIIINNPNPNVVITPANPAFCSGGSVTLTCNTLGNSYQWTGGAVTQSISVSTTGTYTVTVTQNGGCTATGSTTVTVNANPVPAITGINSICTGTTTTFNAGGPYNVYNWSGAGSGAAQTITAGTVGTYTVTVTDANGCTGTATRTLTLNPLPVPAITGTTTFCQGQNSTLNAGPFFTSYNWGGGNVAQTLGVSTGGTYTVTVYNGFGCSASTSTLVTVNPLPIPAITGTLAFCQGSTTTLTASPGFTYQWSGGGGTNQTLTTSTANTYTVTVTDANSCTATTSATTIVNANPVPAITGINSICTGTTTTFSAGGPYSTYNWSGAGAGALQTITAGTAGTYTVTVTDANGCTGTASRTLTLNPLPVPAITGITTFCQGQNSTLNAGPFFTSYNWGGGNVAQTLGVSTGGTYTVTVYNGFGCSASTSTLVTVNPLPVPAITGTLAFCQGSNTTLTASPGFTYQWSGGNGSGQTVTTSVANTYTVTVTDANGCTANTSATTVVNANPVPAITGINSICTGTTTTFNAGGPYNTYNWSGAGSGAAQTLTAGTAGTYTVTVTDANGCTGTATRTLTLNPLPVPAITGTTTFCQGASSTLNAGAGFTSYNWGSGNVAQTLSVSTGGTYTVTVYNGFGCSASTSTLVTVNALPVPVITGSLAFCQGFNTTLDAGPGYTQYQWSGGGGANQTLTTSTANTYTVTVTDVNGCVNNTSATTVVNANPVPVISGTFTTCNLQTTQIDAGAGYNIYNWSTGANTQTINIGTAGPVSVTVTDINGCVGTANTSITVYALPVAAISGIDTICFGQATNIGFSFSGPGPYTYTYSDGSANQGPFTTPLANININVNPTTNTNYSLVTVSNNNCTGTVSGQASIQVTPLPSAVISGTTALCNGNNTNLTINFSGVAPYTYSYTAGAQVFGPFTTNNNSEIINVAPTASTTYGLTATLTGFGCVGNTDPASAIVTVNALPSATITGDNTVCNGTSTDLTFSFVGTGPYSYSYSNGTTTFGPFATPNNPTTVSVTPSLTTTYNMVSISDANCPGSVSGTADIIVNPLPTATMSGTSSICDGTNTDLTIQFTGTGPYNYSYNNGSTVFGPYTTSQNPILINVNPVTNTTYGVTTISDANCPGSGAGSAAITVIPLPTSTLSGSTEICKGSTTNMTLSFVGVSPFEYIYSDGTNTFGPTTTNNLSTPISVTPGSNTSYHVTLLTGAGCVGTPSGTVDIIVNDIPAAEAVLSGNAVICNGENSEFSIEFTGLAPYTYSYSNGTSTIGPITTSNNPEFIPVNPNATTSYSLVNMSDNKCPGLISGVAQVVVNPLPVATVTGNPSICNGSGTSFTVGFTGTGPYTYSYSDGAVNYGPFTTANNPETIQVAPILSTSYNVISVNDANCVGSSTGVANVTVNQIPSAIITGDASICIGTQTNLNVSFVGVAPFNYVYTNGVNSVGPLISLGNSVNIPVTPGTTSTYTLLNINDANCPGTISGAADVIVNPLPTPAITGTMVICDGQSSTLSATPGYTNYVWSTGNNASSINVTVGGPYGVTVTDVNGCVGSTAVNFTVNQTPVISFTNDTSLTCTIPKINFFNNSLYPAGSQFAWNFGDTTSSQLSNPSHVYSTPGTYNVDLTITTQLGCTSTLSQAVDIMFFPLAQAKFIADPEVTNVFNSKVQFTDMSDYAVSWLWDFNDGVKSIEQNPYHYFNEIGNYKVTLVVNNIAGCPDLFMREIVVNPFYIPNAFTPNADGTNDYFFDAGYVLDVLSFKMAIFNRWGQKVYETDNYQKFWNGLSPDGSPAPEGVYVYSIEVKTKGGKEHQFNGTVSLIK